MPAALRANATGIINATIDCHLEIPWLKEYRADFVTYQSQMPTVWARMKTQRALA